MDRELLIKQTLDCCFKVHTKLGPRLLEGTYQACVEYELTKSGLFVESQKNMPLIYDEINLQIGYRIDLFIENEIILELKTVEYLNDVHLAQILTYLKLANKKIGLLINFNEKSLKNGIKRVINSKFIEG